jgi:hypothetical protein
MESASRSRKWSAEPKRRVVRVPRCARCLNVMRMDRKSRYCRSCLWQITAVRLVAAVGICSVIVALVFFLATGEQSPAVIWVE